MLNPRWPLSLDTRVVFWDPDGWMEEQGHSSLTTLRPRMAWFCRIHSLPVYLSWSRAVALVLCWACGNWLKWFGVRNVLLIMSPLFGQWERRCSEPGVASVVTPPLHPSPARIRWPPSLSLIWFVSPIGEPWERDYKSHFLVATPWDPWKPQTCCMWCVFCIHQRAPGSNAFPKVAGTSKASVAWIHLCYASVVTL